MALLTILTNGLSTIYKIYEVKTKKSATNLQNIGIIALNSVDLLSGLYLLIVATADSYYRGKYVDFAKIWRTSVACRAASGLLWFGMQMSTSILFMLSLVRMYSFWKPFSSSIVTLKRFWITLICTAVGLALQVIFQQIFLISENSHICMSLQVSLHDTSFRMRLHIYSIFIIVLFNVMCMVGILIMNVLSVFFISKSRKSAGRKKTRDENIMVARAFIVSLTNFLSWAVSYLLQDSL